jgi:hypothetical protein
MRLVLGIVLVLPLLLAQLPQSRPQPRTSNTPPQQNTKPKTKIAPTSPAQPTANPTNQECDHIAARSQPEIVRVESVKRDWLDIGTLGLSALLVVVGIVGAGIALYTLAEIKKEVEHANIIAGAAKDAADAALLNARAVIDSERPWVLVENLILLELLPMEHNTPVQTRYEIQNYGRTAARLVRARTKFQMSNQMDGPPNPEIYEDAGGNIPQRIVPPMLEPRLLNFAFLEPDRYLSTERIQAINNGAVYFWAYGFVAYRDTLGTDREYMTRFCYCYIVPPLMEPARFCLAGPPEYNAAT